MGGREGEGEETRKEFGVEGGEGGTGGRTGGGGRGDGGNGYGNVISP